MLFYKALYHINIILLLKIYKERFQNNYFTRNKKSNWDGGMGKRGSSGDLCQLERCHRLLQLKEGIKRGKGHFHLLILCYNSNRMNVIHKCFQIWGEPNVSNAKEDGLCSAGNNREYGFVCRQKEGIWLFSGNLVSGFGKEFPPKPGHYFQTEKGENGFSSTVVQCFLEYLSGKE